ncbi:MAG: YdcF family protein [Thermodesulfobacteriota bacterium]
MANGRSLIRKIFFILHLLLWLALSLVVVIAYTPLTLYMLKPLTVQEEIKNADLILVLGGGIDKGRYLTLVSSHRLVKGAQLYFEGRANKILVSGGIPGKVNVPEAAVMAQEAKRLKIPAGDILLENKSQNTHAQAVEVKKIADSLQLKSILLVTSFSHMKRSLMTFENLGFKIYPAPADPYERYTDDPMGRLCLFPKLVHEYGGMVYYKIRGWI